MKSPARPKWWHHVLFSVFLATTLVFVPILWRGVPTTRDAWVHNVEMSLVYSVPFVTLQFVFNRLRERYRTREPEDSS
jgi:hypothetical protein